MAVRTLRALAGLGAALALAGCAGGSALGGFTPLYASPGVHRGLSTIQVVAPQGRTAYMLREALEDSLATERDAPPAFRLDYKVTQTRIPRGLRVDNIANRYEVNTTVVYVLRGVPNRAVLTRGVVRVKVTSDSADQPYAGVAVQSDADRRSAEEAADRIAMKLGAYFANPTSRRADGDRGFAQAVDQRTVGDRLGAQDITRDPGQMSGTAAPDAGADGVQRIPPPASN